ncbi:conserved Plasmodium protein, unknown function [Plasmodium knowlesi strain H]|uniref:Vacuolar import/degradation Vid27 C-terminal domain-containing protein n=3 Tax=Plasmodium knowlesi TaxID=5850 RepID=A0A5K1US73_PLAKH|nr:conserved Plasmodium protein, unknown function [Plasmodium knowlesi strain H]OTN64214.1 Uncharacterized protein PKNOH_S140274400 [Plasmodium knowlesi]CAA9991155.1 conserved Plasmodium protein, unknown function [Plasmodium knowlesi strain H]SBO27126.1 conserved Plasmodium protein, unknown function [Plasmodium knowlesi strain H]SBO29363.1 conserved Plasmodium protein, unknown function [Plasmodium knowlesi strain H]VVS80629.1 conserved Plasmodium protein, unknown function [Plasmodium knowlesi |eukprot:XP_002262448.1 hypothetical protein, conserved in Plasmodium species [Plasmodium knowlesi strain H]
MLFNKLFKKKTELEVDVYMIKDEECSPHMLDSKLYVNSRGKGNDDQVIIWNNSKKLTLNEDSIHDFKYHELDMCQFKYIKNGLVEEYGLVFSKVQNMYYFFKYIMLSYLKGNIVLCRRVNLFKYEEPVKVLYKKDHLGLLTFNTAKCEHLLVVLAPEKPPLAEAQRSHLDVACEHLYEELTMENVRELYKRNRVFLIYVLNSFNDIYLSRQSIGIHVHRYLVSSLFRFFEYKALYEGGDRYEEYFAEEVSGEALTGEESLKREEPNVVVLAGPSVGNSQTAAEGDSYYDMNATPIEDYDLASLDKVVEGEIERMDRGGQQRSDKTGRDKRAKRAKGRKPSEEQKYKEGERHTDGQMQDRSENELPPQLYQMSEKFLIILESEDVLMDHIRGILIYRQDFQNDIVSIKRNFMETQGTTEGTTGTVADATEGEFHMGGSTPKDGFVLLSESDATDLTDVADSSDMTEVDTQYIRDRTRNMDGMKYKFVNTSGKLSFVLRQNHIPHKRKRRVKINKKSESSGREINYDDVRNDLNIYTFDEYGKEKKIYKSSEEIFRYKNEQCVPKSIHVNDEQGNKILFLNERNDKHLFIFDTNKEKIVKKWDTENVPISQLIRKEENIYCGYNKKSLYFVDTRIKSCVQNALLYGRNTPDIEQATVDNKGRIILTNAKGEIKYYDGKINKNNVLKKSKNVLLCANDIVHLCTTTDGVYSIVTCQKSVVICENYIRSCSLFERVIKKEERLEQNKFLLQIHYVDVFTYNLGDYKFEKSTISSDNTLLFTLSAKFYVVWNFKQILNGRISYVIKKAAEDISDLSYFNISDVQGVLVATENSFKSKKITSV